MSDEGLVNNPLFGAVIGQQIGNNAHHAGQQVLAAAEKASLEQEATAGVLVAGMLRRQVDELTQTELDFTCAIAGVRGVTRELLEELRKSDPNNPLLNKKIRDRVFDSAKNKVWDKVKDTTYKERDNIAQKLRDETYGAEGSNKSGPEKSQITPNLAVRAEAEVPSHVTDREKFLGLIEKLSAELKKANPDAPILKEITAGVISAELNLQ
jgi:hypothetical protein